MTTFVLVHGAWGGSYGFRAVRGPLRAAGHRLHPFWQAAERTKTDPAWRYREIGTDHLIPVKRPAELTELLLELT